MGDVAIVSGDLVAENRSAADNNVSVSGQVNPGPTANKKKRTPRKRRKKAAAGANAVDDGVNSTSGVSNSCPASRLPAFSGLPSESVSTADARQSAAAAAPSVEARVTAPQCSANKGPNAASGDSSAPIRAGSVENAAAAAASPHTTASRKHRSKKSRPKRASLAAKSGDSTAAGDVTQKLEALNLHVEEAESEAATKTADIAPEDRQALLKILATIRPAEVEPTAAPSPDSDKHCVAPVADSVEDQMPADIEPPHEDTTHTVTPVTAHTDNETTGSSAGSRRLPVNSTADDTLQCVQNVRDPTPPPSRRGPAESGDVRQKYMTKSTSGAAAVAEKAARSMQVAQQWRLVRVRPHDSDDNSFLAPPPITKPPDMLAIDNHDAPCSQQLQHALLQHFITTSLQTYMGKDQERYWSGFYCRSCSRCLGSLSDSLNHLNDKYHKRHALEERLSALQLAPSMRTSHETQLSEFVAQLYSCHGLDEQRRQLRASVAKSVCQFVLTEMARKIDNCVECCSLEPLGSLVHGCGLTQAAVDLSLRCCCHDNKQQQQQQHDRQSHFELLVQIISDHSDKFTDVVSVLDTGDLPTLRCCHVASRLKFCFTVYTDWNVALSQLLLQYAIIDQRVPLLVTALQQLANVCGIVGSCDDGLLTAPTLSVMTVYFLQHTSPPVLPCLHQMTASRSPADQHHHEGSVEESAVASGDHAREEEQHHQQQEDNEDVEDADPSGDEDEDHQWQKCRQYLSGEQAKLDWTASNTASVAALWLELLRWLSLWLLRRPARTMSILQTQPYTRNQPASRGIAQKLFVQDPFQPRRNMAWSLACSVAGFYIGEQLASCLVYFSLPSLNIAATTATASNAQHSDETYRLQVECVVSEIGANAGGVVVGDNTVATVLPLSAEQEALQQLCHVPADDFNWSHCHNKQVIFCGECQKRGHRLSECPSLSLLKPEPLPPLSEQHCRLLDHICHRVFESTVLPEAVSVARDRLVTHIEQFIRRQFAGASLKLFGSSRNGFGTVESDLDICMLLADSSQVNHKSVIQRLGACLYRMSEMTSVLTIASARVPIVKFEHAPSRLSGDISVHNMLALHNTALLRSYATIDRRVRLLGCMLKCLVKNADACGRSLGGISSYACIVMVIYFLQHCQPPVLPVLQQITACVTPRRMVDDCDVTFLQCDNDAERSNLAAVWPQMYANRDSVGELWAGLLRFYTETFDFARQVVCIRQWRPLSKARKLWTSSCWAMEDPFLLSHNLTSCIGRKMAHFLRRCLLHWRRLHCHPVLPSTAAQSPVQWLLDERRLRLDTPAPTRRSGCWQCGARGHRSADCPCRRRRAAGPRRALLPTRQAGPPQLRPRMSIASAPGLMPRPQPQPQQPSQFSRMFVNSALTSQPPQPMLRNRVAPINYQHPPGARNARG